MIYQEMRFEIKPELSDRLLYQGGSHANRTALQESVKHLVMNVTCGRKCGALLAKLLPDGLWAKMYGDCFQAKMDGSLEEYSEILPTWGMMLGGVLMEPQMSERYIKENGLELLPTVLASETWAGKCKSTQQKLGSKHSMGLTDVIKMLPTPTASDYKGGIRRKNSKKMMSNLKEHVYIFCEQQTRTIYLNPQFLESMMGFPTGWTELKPLETQ